MILSKRERYIAITAAVAIGILLLDFYILTPVMALRDQQEAERQSITATLNEATSLFKRQRLLRKEWEGMLKSGMNRSISEAESQIFHALRNWSQESGLVLSSLKPGKPVEHGEVMELTFQAAGTGTMKSVAGFLWRVESAELPICIHQLQLGARKDGEDDLSLQLNLSTLCVASAANDTAEKPAEKEKP